IPTDLPMAKSGGSDPSRLCHAQNPAGSGPSGLAAACSAELARRAGRRLGETTDASKWPSWRSWSHGDPASHDSTRARKEHGVTIDPVHYARRWKTLAVLSLSLFIIGLDNTILNVALPSLQESRDTCSSTLQWTVDSYLLVV